MNPGDMLSLDLIKELLRKIKSVTIAEDMTGPVCYYGDQLVSAVSRRIDADQLNVIDFEKEFGGKTVALYQFSFLSNKLKAGEMYNTIEPETFAIVPVMSEIDVPARYVLRYAIIENKEAK